MKGIYYYAPIYQNSKWRLMEIIDLPKVSGIERKFIPSQASYKGVVSFKIRNRLSDISPIFCIYSHSHFYRLNVFLYVFVLFFLIKTF